MVKVRNNLNAVRVLYSGEGARLESRREIVEEIELVKGYWRKRLSSRAINVDLQKTFDSLHWGLVINVLKAYNFTELFVEWIRGQEGSEARGSTVPLSLCFSDECALIDVGCCCCGEEITRFKIGLLSVRYLGVPLVTRRLTAKDCAPLIGKAVDRVNSWASKMLFFVGRLQLIQIVLYNIQAYSGRHFVLPKGVVKRSANGARINWDKICRLKEEGGLGLRDLGEWNRASIIQQIRALVIKSDTLWVRWADAYVLKGRSFMEFVPVLGCSWFWKKLVKLRSVAAQFIDPGSGDWIGSGKAEEAWQRTRCKIDCLRRWGVVESAGCYFCLNGVDARDHIFFACEHGRRIWGEILKFCGLNRAVWEWRQELVWALARCRGRTAFSILFRLAWSAYVYRVWRERCFRAFGGRARGSEVLVREIREDVCLRLAGTRRWGVLVQ
ncbi:uncharacterized protein LOC120183560 [Hibiscus syriacus]|uniref:uncharacterized protein LOC120183560 n=1 Tax=Hibiscus syriacus TaxID=106335 RepID=UPI001921E9A0|nr:uncharacterized protein LOC120183560 [Hibiscus syriacus]